MAAGSRRKMGHDPLADLGDKEAAQEGAANIKGLERRTTATRRKSSRRKADADMEAAATEARIALLENSFALLAGQAEALVARLSGAGYGRCQVRADLAGRDRIVMAVRGRPAD